ncbi:MAG: hypothetical protein WCA39_02630 [Nitrososphaeraceae archaeon]
MRPENRTGIAIMELSFSIMSSSVLIATIGLGSGHTKMFCSGYAQGYDKVWNQQSGNEQSKSQAQSLGGNDVGINGNNNRVIINQIQNQK